MTETNDSEDQVIDAQPRGEQLWSYVCGYIQILRETDTPHIANPASPSPPSDSEDSHQFPSPPGIHDNQQAPPPVFAVAPSPSRSPEGGEMITLSPQPPAITQAEDIPRLSQRPLGADVDPRIANLHAMFTDFDDSLLIRGNVHSQISQPRPSQRPGHLKKLELAMTRTPRSDPPPIPPTTPPPVATTTTTFRTHLRHLYTRPPHHATPPVVEAPFALGKERSAAAGAPGKHPDIVHHEDQDLDTTQPDPNTQQQQQQQAVVHIQNATTGLLPVQMGRSTPQMQDMAPNQAFPHGMGSNPAALGHSIPNRPDMRPSPRAPNPPMRTWSAGMLDLPMRTETLGNWDDSSPIGINIVL
ncbi:hypothetical protein BDR03DRAFT_1005688 [Suillus americanus]|nr:hypothetical protein BDR03DRAFT_1005688 [Suillus americanus]